jgi:hypothetical protein
VHGLTMVDLYGGPGHPTRGPSYENSANGVDRGCCARSSIASNVLIASDNAIALNAFVAVLINGNQVRPA